MTAEELVIGHYEQTLDPGQEAELAALLDGSPDARALYEEHGRIQSLLVGEAETIETSSKLDKVVIGAALGSLVEIAGHGLAGISIMGKIIAVGAIVAAGGVGVYLLDPFSSPSKAPVRTPAPAVRTVTPPTTPVPAVVESDSTPAQANPATTTDATTNPGRPSAREEHPSGARAVQRGTRSPGIDLDKSRPVDVPHDPKIRP